MKLIWFSLGLQYALCAKPQWNNRINYLFSLWCLSDLPIDWLWRQIEQFDVSITGIIYTMHNHIDKNKLKNKHLSNLFSGNQTYVYFINDGLSTNLFMRVKPSPLRTAYDFILSLRSAPCVPFHNKLFFWHFHLNWWKWKPSGSIACTRKQQPRFYWSRSLIVMNDATPLTPPP